jgi:hypothetical protein
MRLVTMHVLQVEMHVLQVERYALCACPRQDGIPARDAADGAAGENALAEERGAAGEDAATREEACERLFRLPPAYSNPADKRIDGANFARMTGEQKDLEAC